MGRPPILDGGEGLMRLLPFPKTSAVGLALVVCALLASGCGYSLRPNYNRSVHTVYVPVFRSFSYRKDLNLQLTALVQREIQNRTTFKVVGSPEGADTTLTGTIKFADKIATVPNGNNLPRQVMDTLMVEVKWVDNRELDEKKDPAPVVFYEQINNYPELGETSQLGFTKALEKLARQIVDTMQEPW
jgi:Lipopolysaccharide-assembly